jgi:hypothetical protein
MSVEATSINKTSAQKMTIILVFAFIGSLLNGAGAGTATVAVLILSPQGNGTWISPRDLGAGVMFALLALLLFLASFLTLSLYPRSGRHQIMAGVLGIIGLAIGLITVHFLPRGWASTELTLLSACVGFAIAICLLVNNRIKGWTDLGGLELGLLIGIGLRISNLYSSSSLVYSPIWLSAVFFPELFSRRAGWHVALLGFLLWVGLIALSVLLARFL